ncbi:MAG: stage III sporulation protein AE [Lachnospiraceae bacterium]|jgi:stage III sporulation protein AE|nr:stage III sporulation protein AE [Lachnospiraceae bacterium]
MENAFDIQSVTQGLDSLFPNYQIDIDRILSLITQGQLWEAGKDLIGQIIGNVGGELTGLKTLLVSVLVLGILSAVFSDFADIFSGQQISRVGYYFTYLFLMAVLTRAFLEMADVAVVTIESIVLFVKVLVPAYFMAVGAAVGITTATAGYQIVLVVAYGVQSFLLAALMPIIYSYVVMSLINGLWAEERLTMLLDLMKKAIGVILKTALGMVAGISFIQSIITPAIDGVKASAFKKLVSVIPGIGNLAEGVTEMVMGSAVLLKNSIGILFLILLVVICAVPLLKILALAGMMKLSAALAGVVGDKRLVHCTDRVGDAGLLLFKTVFTVVALFFILIAIAAYTIR